MDSNINSKIRLAAKIERWMESGEPEVSLSFMLSAVDGDVGIIRLFLEEWKVEGRVLWMLPLDPNDLGKPIVRFSHYLTKYIPWPAPFVIEHGETTITIDLYGDGKILGVYPERQVEFVKKYLPKAKIIST